MEPTAKSVVCDGNSITFGGGDATAYPMQLQAFLRAQGGVAVTNVGVAGNTTQQLINAFAAKVVPAFGAGAALVFFEQYNSFNPSNGNRSVEQEKTLVQTYVSQAQAAGFKVWVCTPPPTIDTDINDKITLYTAWLRDNHGFADGFIDINAMAVLYPPGYLVNPTYFFDSVHLTVAGYAALAELVFSALFSALYARTRIAKALYGDFMRNLLSGALSATKLVESDDGAGNLTLTPE